MVALSDLIKNTEEKNVWDTFFQFKRSQNEKGVSFSNQK